MKNCLLALSFMFIASVGDCQLTQGTWLVGGTGKFYTYSNEFTAAPSTTSKYTEIDISPNIGYFVADKFALGLRSTFSYLSGKVTSPGGGETKSHRLWIGPFGRYYFLDADKPTNLVLESCYQFGTVNFGLGQKGNLTAFTAFAGPVFYFNSSVGIEFLLGYSFKQEEITNVVKDVKKGFQIGIGMQFHLTK